MPERNRPLILIACALFGILSLSSPPRAAADPSLPRPAPEVLDDPPGIPARPDPLAPPAEPVRFRQYTAHQVNVEPGRRQHPGRRRQRAVDRGEPARTQQDGDRLAAVRHRELELPPGRLGLHDRRRADLDLPRRARPGRLPQRSGAHLRQGRRLLLLEPPADLSCRSLPLDRQRDDLGLAGGRLRRRQAVDHHRSHRWHRDRATSIRAGARRGAAAGAISSPARPTAGRASRRR